MAIQNDNNGPLIYLCDKDIYAGVLFEFAIFQYLWDKS